MGLREKWYNVRARIHDKTPKGFGAQEDFTNPKAPKEETGAPPIAIGGMLGDEKGMSALRLGSRVGVGLAAATGLAAGAWQGYHNLIASEPTPRIETIDSVPGGTSFDSKTNRIIDSREVFDNTAKKTSFGEKNAHFISLEEAKKNPEILRVVINKEEGTIEFVFPFLVTKGTSGTVERVDLKEHNPAYTDPRLPKPSRDPTSEPINLQFDNIVSIFVPDENMHVNLVRGVEWVGDTWVSQDPNFAGFLRIYKYYKEEDTSAVWSFFSDVSDPGEHAKLNTFRPLLPMRDFDKEVGRGTNYEKLPIVDILTKPMATKEPNQPIYFTFQAYHGKVAGPEAEIAGDDFLLKARFKTDENGQLIIIALED